MLKYSLYDAHESVSSVSGVVFADKRTEELNILALGVFKTTLALCNNLLYYTAAV